MATVHASPFIDEIAQEFGSLRRNEHVQGVLSQWIDEAYVIWVGIVDDNDDARQAVYRVEDQVSEKFPHVLFDFHVIALPEGRTTQDYVSNAQVVFQRSA